MPSARAGLTNKFFAKKLPDGSDPIEYATAFITNLMWGANSKLPDNEKAALMFKFFDFMDKQATGQKDVYGIYRKRA